MDIQDKIIKTIIYNVNESVSRILNKAKYIGCLEKIRTSTMFSHALHYVISNQIMYFDQNQAFSNTARILKLTQKNHYRHAVYIL